jgi:hypothetical protein
MKSSRLFERPWLIFLPFLLMYTVFIVYTSSPALHGDEVRHMSYVRNLSQGFFSPPPPNVDLEVGPGYPLFLLPFYLIDAPLLVMRLMNGVLLYFSLVLLYATLRRFVSTKITLIASFFWAFYYNSVDYIGLLYSESLAIFLTTAFLFLVSRVFDSESASGIRRNIFLSGLALSFLILTKLIFGYVLLVMLAALLVLWMCNRHAVSYRRSVQVLSFAFLCLLPYLNYTLSLSGRYFYWGTSAGLNIYPMSTPYVDEYGSYIPGPTDTRDEKVLSLTNTDRKKAMGGELNLINRTVYVSSYMDSINRRHKADYDIFDQYTGVARDDAYSHKAMENIRNHPVKFIRNCFSNLGRIFFNFPYSYMPQKPSTLARLPMSGTLLLLMLLAVYPTLINWRRIPFVIRFLLLFALIYLGGSVPGSAETRMLTTIVPVLLLWLSTVLGRVIRLDFSRWKQ